VRYLSRARGRGRVTWFGSPRCPSSPAPNLSVCVLVDSRFAG
jgi:hypothetical protein